MVGFSWLKHLGLYKHPLDEFEKLFCGASFLLLANYIYIYIGVERGARHHMRTILCKVLLSSCNHDLISNYKVVDV